MNTKNKIKSEYCKIALCMLAAFVFTGAVAHGSMHVRTYRVTVQNLTEGQALTPPLVAAHEFGTDLFMLGEPASAEIQAIAENGNNMPMQDLLMMDPGVLEVTTGSTGPLVPASNPGNTDFTDSTDIMITADPSARFLSLVSMLICTNDGFTGLNGLPLPLEGADIVLTHGYDAGTEMNTEDYADLVPPCQGLFGVSSGKMGTGETNPMLAENGVVSYHAGIQGGADLMPEEKDWNNPVAKITITAVDPDANWFVADLSGAGEVPIVPNFATGKAFLRLNDQRQDLDFELVVDGISGVTQAHIHVGLPGENGPVVAFLFGQVPPLGLFNGELSRGTITEADLLADFEGDWEGFAQAIRDGRCYVNVHTADNPAGEIRGQIGARLRGPR